MSNKVVIGNNVFTHKQAEFIKEYVKSKNATQSYIKAYSTSNYNTASTNGSMLLANNKVKQTIDYFLEVAGYTPLESINRITTIANKALEAKPTASDGIRADELLLKLSGNLTDKKTITKTTYNIDKMSIDDLLKLKKKYDEYIQDNKE
jgi:hypothetical protein